MLEEGKNINIIKDDKKIEATIVRFEMVNGRFGIVASLKNGGFKTLFQGTDVFEEA